MPSQGGFATLDEPHQLLHTVAVAYGIYIDKNKKIENVSQSRVSAFLQSNKPIH
jgi:hypothetical protein